MVEEEAKSIESSNKEKLEIALTYKNEGNDFFKQQNYKKALMSYGKSLAYVKGLKGKRNRAMMKTLMPMYEDNSTAMSDEDDDKAMSLEAIVETNIGVCYCKLGDPRKGIDYFDKAIVVDSNYWKPNLRKSEAYLQLKVFNQARNTLSTINTSNFKPEDKKVIEALADKINKSERAEDKKSSQAFKGIFQKL